jgi:integrase
MPTISLTKDIIDTAVAEAGRDRTIFWDKTLSGFGLMVTQSGHRSYVVQYRNGEGVSRRYTIPGKVDLEDARKQARAIQGDVAREKDPVATKRAARKATVAATEGTFKKVAETWLKAVGRKLRTKGERERVLEVYIYPVLGSRPVNDIKRSEIVKLLDKVEKDNGATQSQHCLTAIRSVMTWHALRDDDFKSPIVRGMARVSIKEQARDRTLTDFELRALWATCERLATPYARLLQFILLTATRLREAARMNRSELETAIDWVIPKARYKATKKTERDFLIPLSAAAQSVLAVTPVIGKKGWVFTNDGQKPLAGFSKAKREFDKEMLATLREKDPDAKVERWTTHDLRRTARSLMSRAKVPARHAEIALGHILPGVEGTYDRHEYRAEKLAAFEKLAAEVERIVKNCGTADT